MLFNYTISDSGIVRDSQKNLLAVWDREDKILETNEGRFECHDEIEVEMFLFADKVTEICDSELDLFGEFDGKHCGGIKDKVSRV